MFFNVPVIAKEIELSNLKSGKLWKLGRGQKIVNIQGGGVALLLGVAQKIFIFEGLPLHTMM